MSAQQQRRAKRIHWLIGFAVVGCVLLFVLAVYLASIAIKAGRGFLAQFLSLSPPAQVHVGQQLPWRTLYKERWPGLIGAVAVGDFTGDGDDDVLFIKTHTTQYSGSDIIEIDGTITPAKLSFGFFIPGATGWDFDGDGVDEVVPHHSAKDLETGRPINWPADKPDNLSLHSAVFKTDMSISGFLFGGGVWQESYRGDYDGDGQADLMLLDFSVPGPDIKSIFYGQQGQKLGICTTSTRGHRLTNGDVDGDGRHEIICVIDTEVHAYRYEMPIHKVCNTPAPYANGAISMSDVDGDGCDDLLNPWEGYLNIKTDSYVTFNYPASAHYPQEPYGEARAGDFDGDGVTEVAIALGEIGANTGLYIFDPSGNCTYYEEMGSVIEEIELAQVAGRDHLIVALREEIRVYP